MSDRSYYHHQTKNIMANTNTQTFTEFVLNYLTKGKISKTDYSTPRLTQLLMKLSPKLQLEYKKVGQVSKIDEQTMWNIALEYLNSENV